MLLVASGSQGVALRALPWATISNAFSVHQALLFLNLQLWMSREKATTLEFISTWFHSFIFIDSGCQIGLAIFFRDLDSYVHAVVFNYGDDKRSKS